MLWREVEERGGTRLRFSLVLTHVLIGDHVEGTTELVEGRSVPGVVGGKEPPSSSSLPTIISVRLTLGTCKVCVVTL